MKKIFLTLPLLFSAFTAQAKTSCLVELKLATPVPYQRYQASFTERLTSWWNNGSVIQSQTDLTNKLNDASLNRVDEVQLTYKTPNAHGQVKFSYPTNRTRIKKDMLMIDDVVVTNLKSPEIVGILGVRYPNPSREKFESLPMGEPTLSEGDHVSLLLDRTLIRDPEYRMRLVPNAQYLEGKVVRLKEGSDGPEALIIDDDRRLFQIPVSKVIEIRKSSLPTGSAVAASLEAFKAFGISWGEVSETRSRHAGQNAIQKLKSIKRDGAGALLVNGLPRIGMVVIPISSVDRLEIAYGEYSFHLPWLNLDIPYTSALAYVSADR